MRPLLGLMATLALGLVLGGGLVAWFGDVDARRLSFFNPASQGQDPKHESQSLPAANARRSQQDPAKQECR